MLKTKRSTERGIFGYFALCFGVSILIFILLSIICAAILLSLDDPTAFIGVSSLVVLILSALISGIVSVFLWRDATIGRSALTATLCVLIMLLINVIISSGKISLGAIMNYVCYIGSYLLGALITKHLGGRRRHR